MATISPTSGRHRPQQIQHRVPSDVHAQRLGQPGTGPSGQCDRDLRQRRTQRRTVPRMRTRQATDLLNERDPRTGRLPAPEPAHTQHDNDLLTRHRRVGQLSLVAAMRTSRQDTTARARSRCRAGSRLDDDNAAVATDFIDDDTAQMRQQNFTIPP
jgi:hypothetical protein